jgi:CheY-like chemotaxis protein
MPRTILIVDDEPLIIDTLAEILTWDGYEVSRADNGAMALEIISERKPDVLLIDLMMPVKDGLATMRELRSSAETKDLAIVLMTAAPQNSATEYYDALLVKPFKVAALRTAIEAALSARRRSDAPPPP